MNNEIKIKLNIFVCEIKSLFQYKNDDVNMDR